MIIQHNKPTIGEEELNSVKEVIESAWISQGIRVESFENNFSKYLGLNNNSSLALSSGTAALYLALKILNISENDEIIIPTYVCNSLLNAIYMLKAKPIITDIDFFDFNISYEEIKKNITVNSKAIIIPHIFGFPVDIEKIKSFGLPIIEDCANSLGSTINNIQTGTFGDISIFSFFSSKFITTGNGGMLVTKNKNLFEKALDYREFDNRDSYYPRFNFQMSDIQASIGIEQIKKIEYFLICRKKISDSYKNICKIKGWEHQVKKIENSSPNYFRFILKTTNNLNISLKKYLLKNNIKTIIPIENNELLHRYISLDFKKYPIAENISKNTLSLPIYPSIIKDNLLDKILEILGNF